MWSPIIATLTQNHRFIISSHLNPDCDALGSELALARHLLRLGKQVTILNADPVPAVYSFLDPTGLLQPYAEETHHPLIAQADAIIVVDASGGWKRLGRVGQALAQVDAVTICIDHHPPGEPFTDLQYIDSAAAATGELIFDLITRMGGSLTLPIAEALYAALITDTGSFRFSSTRPHTHRIAGALLECGVNPARMYNLLYEQYPLPKLHLKGHILQTITLRAGGQIACVGLSQKTLQAFNVTLSDLDGFSGLAGQIKGVKLSIFLVELPGKRVKVSLRSNGQIAVNGLAAHFGGGGHVPAAGAVINAGLAEATEVLVAEAAKLLPENQAAGAVSIK